MMKKLTILMITLAALAATGCQTTHMEFARPADRAPGTFFTVIFGPCNGTARIPTSYQGNLRTVDVRKCYGLGSHEIYAANDATQD